KVRLYLLGGVYNTTSGSIGMTVGENTSMTFDSGLAYTYVQRYNSYTQEWGPNDVSDTTQEDIAVTTYPAGTTITATVSIPSDTSQTGTSAAKNFQNALFQYAGSSGSSGSSSGGGAAIMGPFTPVTVTSTPTYVADSSATADMSGNSTIKSATVKTSENGTAKIANVESKAKTVKISSKVKVDGVSYTVKTIGEGALDGCANATTVTLPKTVTKIEENALSGAENLKVVKLDVKKSIKVEKGAFGDTDTSKMTIKVSKDMSKKEFNKFKKVLKSAGFEGKVKSIL
ncbi:MAG: leucine-rich repeat domain-containing protein, partial [Lachnospiraceae bacterium]|nr:leucine-rich repeat domain-containing protein [Lachnospiraceae bacterium]